MLDTKTLDNWVSVAPRFVRSISLDRDWTRSDAIDGYILTPSGRQILQRIASSLEDDLPSRAITITGPYGSGKSAFVLYCARLLAGSKRHYEQARDLLRQSDEELCEKSFTGRPSVRKRSGFFPILVSGSREAIERALVSSVSASLRGVYDGKVPKKIRDRLDSLSVAKSGEHHTSSILALLEDVLEAVTAPKLGFQGILLVIDELGKFLEYAGDHPERGDVFILQGIAEMAARSERPFLVVTVLHQAMERYAEHLSPARRQEWMKVQGRFDDVAFEETTDQTIRLMAEAIRFNAPPGAKAALDKQRNELTEEAWNLTPQRLGFSKKDFSRLLARCFPLHPATTLVLGPLFRRIAQNERSLFAFLASGEHLGFQEFIRNHSFAKSGTPLFCLDDLYDYVTTSLGSSLLSQHRGRQWAEVQSVLEGLRDATPVEMRLAKVIGLLQAIGASTGLPASLDVLRFVCGDDGGSAKSFKDAVASLQRRSAIIYRRHANSYALWQGSDIDIDVKLEEARRAIDPSRKLVSYLSELAPLRPLVARRHSHRTGTLRYFSVVYADLASLRSALTEDFGTADGRIVYCVPSDRDEREEMQRMLLEMDTHVRSGVIGVVPAELFDLQDYCRELACLRWIVLNTPELHGDPVARKEVKARTVAVETHLESSVRRAFLPNNNAESGATWYSRSIPLLLRHPRHINSFLSEECDALYNSTPIWRNELVNRRALSSSAAAARRNLLQAMIEHPTEESLGISGNPPEKSIYDCILREPGLHRLVNGNWTFSRPDPKHNRKLVRVWDTVDEFLLETELARKPVRELFALLSRPPFGLKDGVLPILLTVFLLHHEAEIALYEDGSFVPVLTIATIERLLRSPESFDIQRYRLSGPRALVFQKYAAMLSGEQPLKQRDTEPRILSVVRPLVRFVRQLPDYVASAPEISQTAKAVLGAIQIARGPDQLLFSDLPQACGFERFMPEGKTKKPEVERFFAILRTAIGELQQAYPKLQATIQSLILKAFSLAEPLQAARHELSHRAKLVSELAVDAKLKAFTLRAMDEVSDDPMWLESLAALFGSKPSRTWNEQDRARFEVNLAMSARMFRHFEVLAFELERGGQALLDGDAQALRVSVTVPHAEEIERVVRIPAALRPQIRKTEDRIRRILQDARMLEDSDAGVALLAEMSRQLLLGQAMPSEGRPGRKSSAKPKTRSGDK